MDIGIGSIGVEQAEFASASQRSNKFASEVSKATPEEAAEKMEALFASILVKELRRAMPEGGFFGDGPGADTYNGWFDEHLGAALAKSGSLDMAGLVKTALDAKAQSGEGGEDGSLVIRGLREPADVLGAPKSSKFIEVEGSADHLELEKPLVIRDLDKGATR